MNMKQDIQHIRDRASRIISPKGLEKAPEDDGPCAGQVWKTLSPPPFPADLPPDCQNQEPYLVLVLGDEPTELSGHAVYHVMPIHLESAQAGPDDILLPREVFGHRVVVCAGASIPVLKESLDVCVGALPNSSFQLIAAFQDWLEGILNDRPNVLTGLPYLDEQDIRWRYKEAMAADLAYLQTPVVVWMERSGLLGASQQEETAAIDPMGSLIHFPFGKVGDEMALAADSSLSAERSLASRQYRAVDLDLVIQVSEAEDPGYLSLEVVEDSQNLLEGAVLIPEGGNAIRKIEGGMAHFAAPATGRFSIRVADGREVAFLDITPDEESGRPSSDELDT